MGRSLPLRRSMSKPVVFLGQIVTIRGCGLRLTIPLRREQYLTFKVYPNDGTASVQCDLVKVQWVEEDWAGLAFLSLSQENERRLYQLCGDRLVFELED